MKVFGKPKSFITILYQVPKGKVFFQYGYKTVKFKPKNNFKNEIKISLVKKVWLPLSPRNDLLMKYLLY